MRSTHALVLFVLGGLTLAACGKKNDNADTATSASAAAPAPPAASATPTASAEPTASAAPAAAPTDSPSSDPLAANSAAPADTNAPAPVPGTVVGQRGIEDCCAALATIAMGGGGRKGKNRAFKAAEICPQEAALVRSGRASRAQALSAVIAAGLAGHPRPASCR